MENPGKSTRVRIDFYSVARRCVNGVGAEGRGDAETGGRGEGDTRSISPRRRVSPSPRPSSRVFLKFIHVVAAE
jgi:hypothetical protein